MRPLINDPEAHQPAGQRLGMGFLEVSYRTSGNLYQPPNLEQIKLSEQLPEIAKNAQPFNVGIDDYQAWCELNWKKPHGTADAMERINGKLMEELTEVQDAISPELEIELGDLLWCVNATASNLRVNVKHGLRLLFDEYGHGIRYYEDGSEPEWVKKAQQLTFDNNLDIDDLEFLIEAGYEPQSSTAELIEKPDDLPKIEQIDEAMGHLNLYIRMLVSIAKQNYSPDVYQSGNAMQENRVEGLVSRIYLDVAYLARHAIDSSLSEVIRNNILKLSDRVSTNTVDKADGPRS
jgi:NTP pyrophosphatase (non-canonical NTP hydrolase)